MSSTGSSLILLQGKHLVRFTFVFLLIFFSIPFLAKDNDTTAASIMAAVLNDNHTAVTPQETAISSQLDQMIEDAGNKYQVDPELIRLVIKQESGFKATARSPKNAQGPGPTWDQWLITLRDLCERRTLGVQGQGCRRTAARADCVDLRSRRQRCHRMTVGSVCLPG